MQSSDLQLLNEQWGERAVALGLLDRETLGEATAARDKLRAGRPWPSLRRVVAESGLLAADQVAAVDAGLEIAVETRAAAPEPPAAVIELAPAVAEPPEPQPVATPEPAPAVQDVRIEIEQEPDLRVEDSQIAEPDSEPAEETSRESASHETLAFVDEEDQEPAVEAAVVQEQLPEPAPQPESPLPEVAAPQPTQPEPPAIVAEAPQPEPLPTLPPHLAPWPDEPKVASAEPPAAIEAAAQTAPQQPVPEHPALSTESRPDYTKLSITQVAARQSQPLKPVAADTVTSQPSATTPLDAPPPPAPASVSAQLRTVPASTETPLPPKPERASGGIPPMLKWLLIAGGLAALIYAAIARPWE